MEAMHGKIKFNKEINLRKKFHVWKVTTYYNYVWEEKIRCEKSITYEWRSLFIMMPTRIEVIFAIREIMTRCKFALSWKMFDINNRCDAWENKILPPFLHFLEKCSINKNETSLGKFFLIIHKYDNPLFLWIKDCL